MKFTLSILMAVLLFASCDTNKGKYINGVALPVVTLPDRQQQPLALEELLGNIVLVDIWASWCTPCRKQHGKMVDLYNKYRNANFENAEGFVIYQISLDSDEEAWLKAIEKDKLDWPHHVSELKGWESDVVELYELESIPSSFLLDENGTIIGKDLSMFDLGKVLENRLVK
jgi:thiol-disulfide isomerase/thioredoxin